MPKMRTDSTTRKRFALTGSGNIRRRHAGKGHLNRKKTSARKRRLTLPAILSRANRRAVRQLLGT